MEKIFGWLDSRLRGNGSLRLILAIVVVMLVGSMLAYANRTSNQGVWVPGHIDRYLFAFIQEQDDSVYADANHAEDRWMGLTPSGEGRIMLPVYNKSGGALAQGDCVVWDSVKIAVTADTTKLKPARIVNDLTAEGGPFWLLVCVNLGTASSDTITIYGKDSVGTALTSTLPMVNSAQYTRSAFLWTDVDSVKDLQSSGGWANYIVYAEPYIGVNTSSGAANKFAGVAIGAVADNAVGFVCIRGVTWAVVDGGTTSIYPGTPLYPAANGDMAPATVLAAAAIDAALPLDSLATIIPIQYPMARALEPCFTNDRLIRVMVGW